MSRVNKENKQKYFEGRAWTPISTRQVDVPWAIFGSGQRLVVSIWPNPICLEVTTQDNTKHEKVGSGHGTSPSSKDKVGTCYCTLPLPRS